MNRIGLIFISFLIIVGCKKADERRCYKSVGDEDSLVYDINGVKEFDLGKKIKYRLFQDSTNRVVVRGGKNMITFVELENADSTLSIRNNNRCNFLRSNKDYLEVDIHYEDYGRINCDPTDSLIFMDTIQTDFLDIYLVNGGGFMDLAVDVNLLRLNVTGGVTHFKVGGNVALKSEIYIHILSYGTAAGLSCPNYFINNNTTGDFYVDLDAAQAHVLLRGTGNVYYSGTPDSLVVEKTGDGECLPY